METRVRNRLIQLARSNRFPVSYPTLIHSADLGLNLDIPHEKSQLSEILEDISTAEFEEGRPLLSAMVKIKTSSGQGDHFFKMCERLGMGNWKDLKRHPNFLQEQRDRCQEFWNDPKNYRRYR